jgi:hypothetical protein
MSGAAHGDIGLFDGGPPLKLQTCLGLVKPGQPRVIRRALFAILIGWAPLAVLTAVQGGFLRTDAAESFLFDFGVHARYLIAAPLFVLAESVCNPRLGAIAHHFLDAQLIAEADRVRFDAAVASTRRLQDSPWAEIIVIVFAYSIVAILIYSVPAEQVPAWHRSADGELATYPLAGWWHALVSLPLLLVLFLGWIWRLFLWARFLWLMSRLELRLVPAHPDLSAGLKFVGYSVRAFSLLGLTLGVIGAGRVANGVIHEGASPLAFKYSVIALVVFVVVLFSGPLLVFAGKLLRVWRAGVFQYGALADTVGHQFERKWFNRPGSTDESALDVPDFSATTDLYQIVSNVYEMRFVPLDLTSVIALIVATLLPFLPVVLMTVPLDVVLSRLANLLL